MLWSKNTIFFCLFVPGQNKTRNNVLDRTVTFFFAKKIEIMINNVLDRKETSF